MTLASCRTVSMQMTGNEELSFVASSGGSVVTAAEVTGDVSETDAVSDAVSVVV